MKKVIIIGAGVTGLSAGIHALLKGHEVSIYEKNKVCGGCCGGWYKNNYYIDNCMHWLTGTNQHTKTFKLWKKLGAMDETSNLYQSDYFYKSTFKNESIELHYDLEKTRNNMIKLSPEDRKEIDKFIDTVTYFVKSNKQNNLFNNLFNKSNGYCKGYFKYHKLSLTDLGKKFKHPLLKKMCTDYLPGCYSAFTLIYSYATFASGNGKVYSDGSLQFSKNMEKKFISLGGTIYYNSDVTKINIENNKFNSIIVNDQTIKGDILISCIDPFYLFDNILDSSYMPKALKEKKAYKSDNPIISSYQSAYLVDKKYLNFKDTTIIEIPRIQVGSSSINRLLLKEYSYLPNNDNNVVIQSFIIQDIKDYEYWNQLKNSNLLEYNHLKENIGNKILDILVENDNRLKNNISLLDTWTPVTYTTYFNSFYGSYMGFVFTKKKSFKKLSPKINNLKNIFYLTYWQDIMGGLPVAAKLGSSVSKLL